MNKFRIAHQLWGAFLVLLVGMLLVAAFVVQRVDAIGARTVEALAESQVLVSKALVWRGMTETAVTRSMAAAISTDPSVGALFKEGLANGAAPIKKLREEIVALAKTDADLALLKRMSEQSKVLQAASNRSHEIQDSGDKSAAAPMVRNEFLPATRDYLALIDEFVKLQQHKADAVQALASEERRSALILGAVGGALVFLVATGVAASLVRSVSVPLAESIALANAIAEGDLTRSSEVIRSDEFGDLMRALQHMNQSLGTLVGDVRVSTDSIATASSEIASGNHELSARTEQTAASLQQTSASMQEVSQSVTQNAEAARQADHLAQSASVAATRGGEVVGGWSRRCGRSPCRRSESPTSPA